VSTPIDRLDAIADLSTAEAQEQARDAWRHSGGRLTGAELARRYGRSERWGRLQIAAAREDAGGAGESGTDGTQAQPTAEAAHNGTPRTPPALPRAAAPARPARPHAKDRPSSATPRRDGKRPAQSADVPLPLLAVTAAAVVVVTVVCAVVSYSHIRHLARTAGMGSLAGWLPLGVDGLVVAASCSLIVDRQLGRPGHPLAWAGVALGLAGSLTANVMAVDRALCRCEPCAGRSPATDRPPWPSRGTCCSACSANAERCLTQLHQHPSGGAGAATPTPPVNQKPNSTKGTSPVTTVTPAQLAELLRASAVDFSDGYAAEAAAHLLTGHRSLLTRVDFVTACVDYDHDGTTPVAWIVWEAIPSYVDRAPLSSSEANILRLVAELGGIDSGVPLANLLAGLDDSNARLVLAALAHVLNRGDQR
jgi:hypothetical protein